MGGGTCASWFGKADLLGAGDFPPLFILGVDAMYCLWEKRFAAISRYMYSLKGLGKWHTKST